MQILTRHVSVSKNDESPGETAYFCLSNATALLSK